MVLSSGSGQMGPVLDVSREGKTRMRVGARPVVRTGGSEGNTRLYTSEDLERLEVILKLTRDLGVNLAGVEIILNMREKMGEMQRQIESFVESLNTEMTQRARPVEQAPKQNSLIPFVDVKRTKKG